MKKENKIFHWGDNTRKAGESRLDYLNRRTAELFSSSQPKEGSITVFELQDFTAARRTLGVVWSSHKEPKKK